MAEDGGGGESLDKVADVLSLNLREGLGTAVNVGTLVMAYAAL